MDNRNINDDRRISELRKEMSERERATRDEFREAVAQVRKEMTGRIDTLYIIISAIMWAVTMALIIALFIRG